MNEASKTTKKTPGQGAKNPKIMPTPEQYQRAEAVRQHVRQEIQNLKTGQVPNLTSFSDLSIQFGYTKRGSARAILSSELIEQRKLAEAERLQLVPSRELAWVLGVLAAGAHQVEGRTTSIESDSQELLNAFESRGQRLFKKTARRGRNVHRRETGIKEMPTVSFYSAHLGRALGDLGREHWHETIVTTHKWVIEQETYMLGFLEGFYDKRGAIYDNAIVINISNQGGASLLLDMLTRTGIQNPTIRRDNKSPNITRGVAIHSSKDTNLFAWKIHPVIPAKNAALERFRSRIVKRGAQIIYSDEELIREWSRIVELLGRIPNHNDIKRLKEQGETHFYGQNFSNRFGEGSFPEARYRLITLTGIPTGVQAEDKDPEYYRNKLLRGNPNKKHADDQLISEWQRLTEVLGQPPTDHEISRLRSENLTLFSSKTYRQRFGQGSFATAREQLIKLAEHSTSSKKQKVLELIKSMDAKELRRFSALFREIFNI